MRILLAEDDENSGFLLCSLLKQQGFAVSWVKDGAAAYQLALSEPFDVCILDWMMPERDGVTVCRQLREDGWQGKILLLTAKDAVRDKITGLNSGADDYLVKPFDFDELTARLCALARRPALYEATQLSYGGVTLDEAAGTALTASGSVELRQKEYRLLELLLRNHGRVLPRQLIFERVWGLEGDVSENTLEVQVRYLRQKLAKLGADSLVKTARGVGYYVK